jgi:hypothetical protein
MIIQRQKRGGGSRGKEGEEGEGGRGRIKNIFHS